MSLIFPVQALAQRPSALTPVRSSERNMPHSPNIQFSGSVVLHPDFFNHAFAHQIKLRSPESYAVFQENVKTWAAEADALLKTAPDSLVVQVIHPDEMVIQYQYKERGKHPRLVGEKHNNLAQKFLLRETFGPFLTGVISRAQQLVETYQANMGGNDAEKKAAAAKETSRLLTLKSLVTLYGQTVHGWDILNQLQQSIQKRTFMSRMFQNREEVALNSVDTGEMTRDGFTKALEALQSHGLVTSRGVAASRRWTLTENGKAALKRGNPLKDGNIPVQDLHQLLQLDIEHCQQSIKKHDDFLQALTAQYQAAADKTEALQARLNGLALGVHGFLEESKSAVSPTDKEAHHKKAMAMFEEAEPLVEDLAGAELISKQLSGYLEKTRETVAEAKRKLKKNMQEFKSAQAQLKVIETMKNLHALARNTFETNDPTQSSSKQLENLMDAISQEYYKMDATLDQNALTTRSQSLTTVEPGDDALKSLTGHALEQDAVNQLLEKYLK